MSSDVRRRFLRRQDRATHREVVTPEGIPLSFVIASAGDRIVAFLLDMLIITGVVLGFVLLATAAGDDRTGHSWTGAVAILTLFILRNFYFTIFELRWQGRTPGKRSRKLRVIDARGGMLRADAVIVRNLVRDLEVFLPAQVLASPKALWPGAPGWATLLAVLWMLVFALMPLWNRDRQRIGDLIAGTLVVEAPSARLLEDLSSAQPTTLVPIAPPAASAGLAPLAATPAAAVAAAVATPTYSFTREQLSVYGIYELQVLEDVLRKEGPDAEQAVEVVCEKIRKKIGWTGGAVRPRRFLHEFYAAQRARLEHQLLFGKRKASKED